MNGYELDTYFPLQGTCFDCGRDLRHKLFDKINVRYASGDSIALLSGIYKVPPRAIELVLRQNSVTPLGLTFKPILQSRSATA